MFYLAKKTFFSMGIAIMLATSFVPSAFAKSPPDKFVIVDFSKELELMMDDREFVNSVWLAYSPMQWIIGSFDEKKHMLKGLSVYGIQFQWSDNRGNMGVQYYHVSTLLPQTSDESFLVLPNSNPIYVAKPGEAFNELIRTAYANGRQLQTDLLPLERVPASEPEIVDGSGDRLYNIKAGQLVLIQNSVTNNQLRTQSIAYVVQVKDAAGITVLLTLLELEIPAKATLEVVQPWKLPVDGDYLLEIFVWKDIENPVPLSPVRAVTVFVEA
ncbi:MAG: hypothetical protein QXU32_03625 [Nitrososphaerales archaeon]